MAVVTTAGLKYARQLPRSPCSLQRSIREDLLPRSFNECARTVEPASWASQRTLLAALQNGENQ